MDTIKETLSDSSSPSNSSSNDAEDNLQSIQELAELPDLTLSNDSFTPSFEDILKIIKTSELINQQVKLRLEKLISKLNFSHSRSHSSSIQHIAKSLSLLPDTTSTLRVNKDYLRQINEQKELLLQLFEQVEVLSKEIELDQGICLSESCLIEISNDRAPCCCVVV